MSGVIRTRCRLRRPWRMISCAAACGMRCVKPSSASVSPSWTCSAIASRRLQIIVDLELDGIDAGLAGTNHLRQLGRSVLPHQQHRALRAVALMADVAGHGRDVAGLHRDLGAWSAAVAVLHVPHDLVAELDEPLDTVVAVEHRQHVLLTGRAVEAGLAD